MDFNHTRILFTYEYDTNIGVWVWHEWDVWLELWVQLCLFGCSISISSSTSPWKKVVLISSWKSSKCFASTTPSKNRRVVIFNTGEKKSSKATPSLLIWLWIWFDLLNQTSLLADRPICMGRHVDFSAVQLSPRSYHAKWLNRRMPMLLCMMPKSWHPWVTVQESISLMNDSIVQISVRWLNSLDHLWWSSLQQPIHSLNRYLSVSLTQLVLKYWYLS